ncbi:Stk1 family PASTA domain-containing Ser/Thr kinase [Subtercola endophyticus]|uniref:Stk1 family PASTA domain-containing Ser/Thr kinase n=1 Tax=Subtercola endophyticus TaxID=2895559 RepID=UPI001E3A31DA|nr:Stk1 family PASTA domain-containing Ser/Thr kinase [Subtercola endophyticus]UFS60485.1 protein kinase [Subtercola endophyticus]
MTSAPTDPMLDRLVDGRYQVVSRIARGGMATVYVANDLRLDRRVAIKIMHGHLADDEAFRLRFVQEARSAARLAHPNVVSVFDQGQDDEMAYMVMEYLPGMTLRDLLKDYGRLTTEQTLDIMEAVLGGLAAAHKAGIVHRDVKPENVLLADDGRIKIGDFGLARAASANTATGQALLGTIAYLSPELLTRGVADARSDIYASGIMMYEMLVGEQPYQGEQPMQIAFQHANETVPAPSAKNPSVPPEVDAIVLWATSRDPNERPHDARVLLDELLHADTATSASIAATAAMLRTSVLPPAGITDPRPDVTERYGVAAGSGSGAGSGAGAGHGGRADDEFDTEIVNAETEVFRPARARGWGRKRAAAAAAAGVAGGGALAAGAGAGAASAGVGAAGQAGAANVGGVVTAGAGVASSGYAGAGVMTPEAPTAAGIVSSDFATTYHGSGYANASGSATATAPPPVRPAGPRGPVDALAARGKHRRRRGWIILALVVLIVAAAGGTGWYFSAGPGGQVTVPTVAAGSAPADAVAALTALGLTTTDATANSPTVATGTVIGTDPSGGSSVLNGSSVTVITSIGPAQLPVPTLIGLSEADATTAAQNAHFTVDSGAKATQFSADVASGVVIAALGADGQPLGATYADQQPVHFVVSLGAIPGIDGLSADAAAAALKAVGLVSTVGSTDYSDTVASGAVISHEVPADPVQTGATITLHVSKGPEPTVPDVTGKSWSDAKQALTAQGFEIAYNNDASGKVADAFPALITVSATDPVAGTRSPGGTTITVSFNGLP